MVAGRTASPKGSAHSFSIGLFCAPRHAAFFIYTLRVLLLGVPLAPFWVPVVKTR